MRTIRHLMSGRELNRISPGVSALDGSKFLASHATGTCAVFDDQKLVGVFSERDLLVRVVAAGKDPAKTLVKDVMTRNPVVAHSHETLDACLLKMTHAHCRHLPVFDGETYLGMVSMRDLMSSRAEELQGEIQELRGYVSGSGAGS